MLFSYNWLQSFFEKKLPEPKKLAEILTMSVVEIESVEKKGDDFVFEVDNKSITNRPDLWGHAGLAREIGAISRVSFRVLLGMRNPVEKSGLLHRPFGTPRNDRNKKYLQVKIEEKKLCPRYMSLVIDNIKVGPSPKWVRERLEKCGLDSINNVVDITNYVMLELAQPMHAFDFDKLTTVIASGAKQSRVNILNDIGSGIAEPVLSEAKDLSSAPRNDTKEIIVRKANQDEKIITLDGSEYDLGKNVLVIADDENPIAIAGIKGGKKAEINSGTKTIILEAANFEPISIRKSAKSFNLRTDAAIRFEKGLDPNLAEAAMASAVNLIKEIIPEAEVASSLIDKKSYRGKTQKIKLSFEYINRKIGLKIKRAEIVGILRRLGFEIKSFRDFLEVRIPSWRGRDISIKDDLVEEIARIYGYDNIFPQMPKVELKLPEINLERRLEREVKNILVRGFGFFEVYNYSFVGGKQLEKLKIGYNNYIHLANPISSNQTMMRQSLVPNLILNVRDNLKYFDGLRIFEIGSTFTRKDGKYKVNHKGNKFLPKQEKFISGAFVEKNNHQPFYKIKHCLGDLLKQLNVNLDSHFRGNDKGACLDFQIPKEKEILPWAHPSRSLNVFKNKKRIGIITELNPQVAEKFSIKERVGIFEVSFDEIFKLSGKEKKYQPILKYPSVVLDLSIIINRKILWQDIENLVCGISGDLIKKVEPFDIYEGKNIPRGKKSLAFHITYQRDDRTLRDEEVKELQEKIIRALEEKLGAEVRRS